ncbi:dynein axonemal heavy chain 8-like [Eucyclogobius newberryi]|uniref:dynein axonemal heavy chain 8-like n=1 Tax=Eucyclogobius newberryi TaxID=166745 RepID=UPI003B5A0A24
MQYELLHLQHWSQAAGGATLLLRNTLLVRLQNQELQVNLSPEVLEVLEEARWMKKMKVEVPESVEKMSRRETEIRALQTRLLDLLQDFSSVLAQIPQVLVPLLQTFISEVESALIPGLTTVTWSSLNAQRFVDSVQRPLLELKQVCKCVSDILDCRIGRLLQRMSSRAILSLPEDNPVPPEELLSTSERNVKESAATLSWQSQQVERYVYELIEELKTKMKPAELINLEEPFSCLQPDPKQRTRCTSCLPCLCYALIGQLCHRNTEALVKGALAPPSLSLVLVSLNCRWSL